MDLLHETPLCPISAVSKAVVAWRLVLGGRFRLLNEWCDFVEVIVCKTESNYALNNVCFMAVQCFPSIESCILQVYLVKNIMRFMLLLNHHFRSRISCLVIVLLNGSCSLWCDEVVAESKFHDNVAAEFNIHFLVYFLFFIS